MQRNDSTNNTHSKQYTKIKKMMGILKNSDKSSRERTSRRSKRAKKYESNNIRNKRLNITMPKNNYKNESLKSINSEQSTKNNKRNTKNYNKYSANKKSRKERRPRIITCDPSHGEPVMHTLQRPLQSMNQHYTMPMPREPSYTSQLYGQMPTKLVYHQPTIYKHHESTQCVSQMPYPVISPAYNLPPSPQYTTCTVPVVMDSNHNMATHTLPRSNNYVLPINQVPIAPPYRIPTSRVYNVQPSFDQYSQSYVDMLNSQPYSQNMQWTHHHSTPSGDIDLNSGSYEYNSNNNNNNCNSLDDSSYFYYEEMDIVSSENEESTRLKEGTTIPENLVTPRNFNKSHGNDMLTVKNVHCSGGSELSRGSCITEDEDNKNNNAKKTVTYEVMYLCDSANPQNIKTLIVIPPPDVR